MSKKVKVALVSTMSNEECQRRGLPPMIHWRMKSGQVLHSVFTPTTVDIQQRKHRCYLRRHIPYGAVAWFLADGVERPVSELPKAWGLAPVNVVGYAYEDEEEGETT